jgi:hypothetical protein
LSAEAYHCRQNKQQWKGVAYSNPVNIGGEIAGSLGGDYENVFWDVAPCSLVEVYRRFRGAYCLHHQGGTLMMEALHSE